MNPPLAERMRPKNLDEFLGQDHLAGSEGVIRKMVDSGALQSFILWGPPGVGKTTLARIVAAQTGRKFFSLSAINSGVKDIRDSIEQAKRSRFFSAPNPVLFIDEIHRFSKSQQDSLLGAVEQGILVLIGATTENPSFEVIPPLLSRCQVYILKPLKPEHLNILLKRSLEQDPELKKYTIEILEKEALTRLSGGDARKLLNALELVVNAEKGKNKKTIKVTDEKVLNHVQQNLALYDKAGEQHYDIISAFIKSVRGSDPNAAVYWLARMVEGGEDPLFIARRLVILAAEDIGLANPNALLMANNAFQAVHAIGMPEARIILSEATVYLATSPKSNSAYRAISDAQALVRKTGDLSVPLNIRNASTELMKDLGYSKGYKYAHDYKGNFTPEEFMPEEIRGKVLYTPQDNAREKEILERLIKWWTEIYGYNK